MITRLAAASCLVIAFSSCASKDHLRTKAHPGLHEAPLERVVGPPTEEDRLLAEEALDEAVRLLALESDALWSRWIGLEDDGPLVDRSSYAWLSGEKTVLAVERVANHADGPEASRYKNLHAFLLGQTLVSEGENQDALAMEILPLRQALLVEGDAGERRRIGEEILEMGRARDTEGRARRERTLTALRALGYHDPLEGIASLRRISVDDAQALSLEVLERTDELWRRALSTVARRELGLSLEEVRWVDLPWISRSAGMRVRLRGVTPIASLQRTLAGMGLALDEVDGVAVDDEERTAKDPRALCVPGGEGARLSLPPMGGTSHRAIFREFGCALFFAKRGGIPALLSEEEVVATAHGVLFERLTEKREWLRERGGLTEAEAETRAAASAFHALQRLRHHAARVLFEIETIRGGLEGDSREAAFAKFMERAYLFPVEGRWAHLEADDLLWAIDLIRSEILAARWEEELGPKWWDDPASLAKLEALHARDIAEDYDLGPLLELLESALSRRASR